MAPSYITLVMERLFPLISVMTFPYRNMDEIRMKVMDTAAPM